MSSARLNQRPSTGATPSVGNTPSVTSRDVIKKAYMDKSLTGVFSTYQINVPQLNVDVDRVKVKRQNVKLSDVFQTLQVSPLK